MLATEPLCASCGQAAHDFANEEALGCIPPREVLQFGPHKLSREYRDALIAAYPYYCTEEVVGSFLGRNDKFPSQDEWIRQAESTSVATEWSDDDDDDDDEVWPLTASDAPLLRMTRGEILELFERASDNNTADLDRRMNVLTSRNGKDAWRSFSFVALNSRTYRLIRESADRLGSLGEHARWPRPHRDGHVVYPTQVIDECLEAAATAGAAT